MKKALTNNLGLKVLAFFIAVMLWLIVVNIDDPSTKVTYSGIQVEVINTEILAAEQQTFQIVDETQMVSVTVTAKRSVLKKIKKENIKAVADMKELTLKTQIPIEISIDGVNGKYEAITSPKNLQVKLEEEETKKFPIVPTTTGTVRDGYTLGEITALPEKVTIRGPKSVIDQISRVEAAVNVSGLSKNQELESELVFYDSDGNIIDQTLLSNNLGKEGVSVKVELLRVVSVPLEFDTSEIEAEKGYEFDGIQFEPQEISVAGKEKDLSNLASISIPASELKMTGLTSKTEKIVNVADYLPEGIQLADENAGAVVVTIAIEKNGSKTFEVTVGTIIVNNLNEKFKITYSTVEDVEFRIRGPRYLLEAYAPEGKVSIDLEEYQKAGNYKIPVDIEVPESCVLETTPTVNIILENKE
ncbi:MAG: YbbR-like domain-containing protein [Dorea sp.]